MNKSDFFHYLAQTTNDAPGLEVSHAEGALVYDMSGKRYIDLVGGFSVLNTGHRPVKIIEAIECQLNKYLHVTVYGEYAQQPQVTLAKKLNEILPAGLDKVFFTNSGSEAIEGAMKLAKRYLNRSEIISFDKAYHGSTQGALSIMGDEYFKKAYRPLLPGIRQFPFNDNTAADAINEKTACVIIEPVQGEAGARVADKQFLQNLRKKCNTYNTLLIFDEIQTGFGRLGTMFAIDHYGVVPDIVCLGKALGGGMPLAAFVSGKNIMDSLSHEPELGHITTFGGHPVSCAAGLASIELLLKEQIPSTVSQKEQIVRETLKHPLIKEVRGKGLLLAVELTNEEALHQVISGCREKGVLIDYFIFSRNSFRITPPLTINNELLAEAIHIIRAVLSSV
jgi:acetylornithine/succinyldiaminopimelate/putrescine aminotransferase